MKATKVLQSTCDSFDRFCGKVSLGLGQYHTDGAIRTQGGYPISVEVEADKSGAVDWARAAYHKRGDLDGPTTVRNEEGLGMRAHEQPLTLGCSPTLSGPDSLVSLSNLLSPEGQRGARSSTTRTGSNIPVARLSTPPPEPRRRHPMSPRDRAVALATLDLTNRLLPECLASQDCHSSSPKPLVQWSSESHRHDGVVNR